MIIELNDKQKDKLRVIIFHALSEPTRLEIIRFIKNHSQSSNVPAAEIYALGTTKSVMSYHGKILHDANLIDSRKQGREKFVCLVTETFEQFLPGFLDTL